MMFRINGHAMINWQPSTGYLDRKSTRLNSSHSQISYAVFCLKKKIAERLRPTARPTTTMHPSSRSGLAPRSRHRRLTRLEPQETLERHYLSHHQHRRAHDILP